MPRTAVRSPSISADGRLVAFLSFASNLVPGVGFSPDRMLQARIFAYSDQQRYRIGPNSRDLIVHGHLAPGSRLAILSARSSKMAVAPPTLVTRRLTV